MSDNGWKESYLEQMGQKRQAQEDAQAQIDRFTKKHNEYYRNELREELVQDETTQVYCQSMKLSKDRLDKHGLTMEVEYDRRAKKGNELFLFEDTRLKENEDNKNVTTEVEENITAKRIFYKDGKKIFFKKAKEICHADFLSSAVEGDEVCCPNCANVAKLEEFRNGCAYCNAKFTVKELEEKVSGYSFREDVGRHMENFLKGVNKGLAIFLIALPFLCFFLLTKAVDVPQYQKLKLADIYTLLAIFAGVGMIALPCTIGIMTIFTRSYVDGTKDYYKGRIKLFRCSEPIPKTVSMNDFAQNLEWKFRNLLLAEKGLKSNVFAGCNVSAITEESKNVVDCSLTTLDVEQFRTTEEHYALSAQVHMRCYKYVGDKIKDVTEKYNIKMKCRRDVEERKLSAIRQYICEGCGSNVDILGSGKCAYCGREADFSELGWTFDSLEYAGVNKINYFKHVSKIFKYYMIGVAVAIVIVMFVPNMVSNIVTLFDNSQQEEFFGHADTKGYLQDLFPEDVVLVEEEEGYYCTRRLDYKLAETSTLSTEEIVEQYKAHLGKYSYQPWQNENTNIIEMRKVGMMDGIFLYYKCEIRCTEDTIMIYESGEAIEE